MPVNISSYGQMNNTLISLLRRFISLAPGSARKHPEGTLCDESGKDYVVCNLPGTCDA